MREIKFRAKSKKNGEWLYGDLLHNRGDVFIAPVDVENPLTASDYEIDENTIGQFTGLKDAKGVDIYEGDIVKVQCLNSKLLRKSVHAEIIYSRAEFRLKLYEQKILLITNLIDNELEIIGNVYDNKDLMKGN